MSWQEDLRNGFERLWRVDPAKAKLRTRILWENENLEKGGNHEDTDTTLFCSIIIKNRIPQGFPIHLAQKKHLCQLLVVIDLKSEAGPEVAEKLANNLTQLWDCKTIQINGLDYYFEAAQTPGGSYDSERLQNEVRYVFPWLIDFTFTQ